MIKRSDRACEILGAAIDRIHPGIGGSVIGVVAHLFNEGAGNPEMLGNERNGVARFLNYPFKN